ncbi:MAG: hypothetical protein K0S75_359 [Clostridia bacterium]|nr:hypothetical protein [Clostridia bacterium]
MLLYLKCKSTGYYNPCGIVTRESIAVATNRNKYCMLHWYVQSHFFSI